MSYLEELKSHRAAAVDALNGAATSSGLFEGPPTPFTLAKRRKRPVATGAEPETVEVSLPGFEYDDIVVEPLTVVMKYDTTKLNNVAIELLPANLAYVRHALLSGNRDGKRRRPKPDYTGIPKSARWLKKHNGWLASRAQTKDGGQKSKLFKAPKGEVDDVLINELREQAKRWADGEDITGHDDPGDDELNIAGLDENVD